MSQQDTPAPPSSSSESASTTTNTSTTDASITNNRDTRTTDSNNTTTVNNYNADDSSLQPQAQNSEIPSSSVNMPYIQPIEIIPNGTDSQGYSAAVDEKASTNIPNIKIEANGVDCIFESGENGISIYINANTNDKPTPDGGPVMATMAMANTPVEQQKDFPWFQIAVVGILLGILFCVFRKK